MPQGRYSGGMAGIGAALPRIGEQIAQILMGHSQESERKRREDEAIRRALAQEERENLYRENQNLLQAGQQEINRGLAESQSAAAQANIRQGEYADTLSMATNFPNLELPAEAGRDMMSKPHIAPMIEQRNPGANLPGALGHLADSAVSTEGLDPSYRLKMPESERIRIAQMNNATKMQVQQLRDNYLQQKLSQDRQLAQLALGPAFARIRQDAEQFSQMLGFRYDALDQTGMINQINQEVDMYIARLRAQAQGQGNAFMMSILGGAGQPGGITPPTPQLPPAGTPPATGVQPPRGGAMPPPSGNRTPGGPTPRRDPNIDRFLKPPGR